MNSEPKTFASLSSGLLARKGTARPAMRPQGFGQTGGGLDDLGWNDLGFEPPRPVTPLRDASHDAFGEGLDSQPARPHATGLTPVQSVVHTQQAEIADRLAANAEDEEHDETIELYEPEIEQASAVEAVVTPLPIATPRRAPEPRSAPGSRGQAAFTLRLDPDRHLKLRLACAVSGRSAQMLVTDAVDQLLAGIPELDAMAAKAKRKE
jgi:hypothetical protein